MWLKVLLKPVHFVKPDLTQISLNSQIPESPHAAKKNAKASKESRPGQLKATKENRKQKEKPKGQIIDMAKPFLEAEMISSSDSESDLDDDSPLASLVAARPMQEKNATGDFFDEPDTGLDLGDLLTKAISTVDKTTNHLNQNDTFQGLEVVKEELRLSRTILERLECSFARQEAKLDRLVDMMTAASHSAPATATQTPQFQPLFIPSTSSSSLEYPLPGVIPMPYDKEEFDAASPRSAFLQAERLMDNLNVTGNDTVVLGGYGNVRLAKTKYNYAKAAHKPTSMTLRLVDSIFTRETLQCSTVHGTKDYAPLDQETIAAIKAEVLTAFSYQCRSAEDRIKMWDQCKISIGKRCQNLRKDNRQNREN